MSCTCYLFSKRGEEKFLICRAAVKPAGRSPKSKPVGAAWLDGCGKANQYNASSPLGKITILDTKAD
ncbi:MAG: hypothetical protein IJ599_00830 [Alphaproteobacteria bacterium]|nr:hypothetical protein [Alphaproteobacteria bacterium]